MASNKVLYRNLKFDPEVDLIPISVAYTTCNVLIVSASGPINTVADVFADPQFIHRGMRIEADGVPGLRTPIRMSDAALGTSRRSPKLGEHTDEVLAGLHSRK